MFNETFCSRFVHNGSHKTFKIEKSPRSRVSIKQISIILDSTPFDFRSIRSPHIQSICMTPTIDPAPHVPQIITRFSLFIGILIRGGNDHETTLDLHHDGQTRNDDAPRWRLHFMRLARTVWTPENGGGIPPIPPPLRTSCEKK